MLRLRLLFLEATIARDYKFSKRLVLFALNKEVEPYIKFTQTAALEIGSLFFAQALFRAYKTSKKRSINISSNLLL